MLLMKHGQIAGSSRLLKCRGWACGPRASFVRTHFRSFFRGLEAAFFLNRNF